MPGGARTEDDERDTPLWATSLDSRPRIDEEELGRFPKPPPEPAAAERRDGALESEPAGGTADPATFPQERQLSYTARRRLALYNAALMTVLICIGVWSERRPGGYSTADLPSSWIGNVGMRCDTTRFESDERVLEFFRCRTLGSAVLAPEEGPIGYYNFRWQSDFTREYADSGQIKTDPPDELSGWAVYDRP